MKTLNEICKKDGKYVKLIEEMSVVKNAVELLGGRRMKGGRGKGSRSGRDEEKGEGEGGEGREGEGREGEGGKEEGEGEEGEEEERRGWILRELRVKEKIGLLKLLNELVKGGVEMEDEEELKEVGMELEEEGNKHVEEEIEGEEEKEEEKREWEELSEIAHNFVWMVEKMKNRREGKKGKTLRMVRKMEEMVRKEEQMKSKTEEDEGKQIKNAGTLLSFSKSLDEIGVEFGDESVMRKENNSIIHNNEEIWVSGFVGGKLDNSVHRMFE